MMLFYVHNSPVLHSVRHFCVCNFPRAVSLKAVRTGGGVNADRAKCRWRKMAVFSVYGLPTFRTTPRNRPPRSQGTV